MSALYHFVSPLSPNVDKHKTKGEKVIKYYNIGTGICYVRRRVQIVGAADDGGKTFVGLVFESVV
jgi:hypothetical protein